MPTNTTRGLITLVIAGCLAVAACSSDDAGSDAALPASAGNEPLADAASPTVAPDTSPAPTAAPTTTICLLYTSPSPRDLN